MQEQIEGGRRLKNGTVGKPPLISIISVVFRARQDLPELLESILRLKGEDAELIVIDGGSDDGTQEFLRSLDSEIDYWISQSDRGIYDAMNKGLAAARGWFVLHLNAGDRLLYLPVQELKVAAKNQVDIAAFRVSIDGRYEFRPSHGLELRFNNTLHHQGTFFRKGCFQSYDTSYRVYGDFDMNQKLALKGSRVALFDKVIALHTTNGVSAINNPLVVSEFFRVIAHNYGWRSVPIAWILCKWRGMKSRFRRGPRSISRK